MAKEKLKKFTIAGEVIDSQTEKGIGRLRVEAWDLDTKYHDLLGVDTTSGQGKFNMTFDQSHFRDFSPEKAPDIFFKVYRGNRLIKSTEDSVIKDAKVKTNATIKIDVQSVMRPGKDRIKAVQVMKTARFVKASDFTGALQEVGDKGNNFTGYVADIIKNSFINIDADPISAPEVRTRDIVNQDVAVATERFQSKNIAVNEVRAYQPGFNARSISELTNFPTRLEEGAKVNLYEQDGKVKYYSIEKPAKAAGVSEEVESNISALEERKSSLADNAEIRNELDTLKSEKVAMTEELAGLKNEIELMNQERAALQDTTELRQQLTELSDMQRELSLSITKDRPVKDISGVGETMDTKLRDIGIRTVAELADAKADSLVSAGLTDAEASKVISEANKKLQP